MMIWTERARVCHKWPTPSRQRMQPLLEFRKHLSLPLEEDTLPGAHNVELVGRARAENSLFPSSLTHDLI